MHNFGTSNTFLLYAFMSFIALAICYFFAPETKGVSLEKIEDNIRKGLRVRDIGKHSKKHLFETNEDKELARS